MGKIMMMLRALAGGAKEAVASGSVEKLAELVDEYKLTEEEIFNAEIEMERELTERLKHDAQSDGWLARNVRPIVFISFVALFFFMVLFDEVFVSMNQAYIPVVEHILITIITFYFGGRSVEKGIRYFQEKQK